MASKKGLVQTIRYNYDNFINSSTVTIAFTLGGIGLLLVTLVSLIIMIPLESSDIDGKEGSIFLHVFASMTGTPYPDEFIGWHLILLGLFSLLLTSFMSAVITAGIVRKRDNLRMGRSLVLEEDHIVILGWSHRIFPIVSELIMAMENEKRSRIVVLANKPKNLMEKEIEEKAMVKSGTKLICRTGNPVDISDIQLACPTEARTIIILPTDDQFSDINVIKSLLAIVNNPKSDGFYNIITEIRKNSNRQVAEIICGHQLTVINTKDITARIKAQTCRQAGLSHVYDELLGFKGAEMYFRMEEALWGKTFKEAVFSYEHAAVIGIRKKKRDILPFRDPDPFLRKKERDIVIKPDFNYTLEEGDSIILISKDQTSYQLDKRATAAIDDSVINKDPIKNLPAEKILILGWNAKSATILSELDAYVPRNSSVQVYSVNQLDEETILNYEEQLNRLKFQFEQADTTDRSVLEMIKVQEYNYVIVLGNSDDFKPDEADSRTLITLVHLRDMAKVRGAKFNLVSEMADPRNQALAASAQPDEFIISDNISSKLFSQLAGNKELKHVFEELFDAYGCEIYLKPVSDYLKLPCEVNFYTVLEATVQKGHIAIGYRKASEGKASERNYGIHLNPKKGDLVALQQEDHLVIIKED